MRKIILWKGGSVDLHDPHSYVIEQIQKEDEDKYKHQQKEKEKHAEQLISMKKQQQQTELKIQDEKMRTKIVEPIVKTVDMSQNCRGPAGMS